VRKVPNCNAFPVNTHKHQDSTVFPALWILIGQFKYKARFEVQLINNISLFFSWQYCGYTYIFGNFSVTSCTEVSEPSSIIAKLRSEKKPVNNYKSIMIMINNVTSSFRNNGHGQMLQSTACSKIDELYLCVFQFVCL